MHGPIQSSGCLLNSFARANVGTVRARHFMRRLPMRFHADDQRETDRRGRVDHPVHIERLNNLTVASLRASLADTVPESHARMRRGLIVFGTLQKTLALPLRPKAHHGRWRLNGENAGSNTSLRECSREWTRCALQRRPS